MRWAAGQNEFHRNCNQYNDIIIIGFYGWVLTGTAREKLNEIHRPNFFFIVTPKNQISR